MTVKSSALAVLAVGFPLALSGTAAAGDRPHPQGAPPGKAVAQEKSQRAAAPKGVAKGQSIKAAKAETKAAKATEKSARKAAPKPAPPAAAKAAPVTTRSAPKTTTNPHAKAGKTTLCHATGSQTNPFVTITISNNGIPAHDVHQNDEDVIPAGTDGCPAPAPARTATAGRTDPLAGAPAPTTAAGPAAPAAAPADAPVTPAGANGVLGEVVGGAGDVLDDAPSRSERGSSAPSGDSAPTDTGSSLPFTGLDLVLVVAAGIAALLGGIALRRSLTAGRTTA